MIPLYTNTMFLAHQNEDLKVICELRLEAMRNVEGHLRWWDEDKMP